MARRKTTNRTNIPRIAGIPTHHALAFFVCVRCAEPNYVDTGVKLLDPADAYETQSWACNACDFVHSKASPLPIKDRRGKKTPFSSWGPAITSAGLLGAQRF